ncbi:MAG: LysM peptidoglycan-binding domain-containing protein [Caldilinea sp.]
MEISPDADRCELCGANLRRLIDAQHASRYFYMRAADLSARSDVAAALAEVQRGLAYQPSSELHLLGAILCKRLDKFDHMRHHVAAIPVDDVLRGEAEWLLRSSQARQRAPTDAVRAHEEFPLSDDELLPLVMEEVRPSARPIRRRSPVRAFATLSVVVLLGLGGWWLWQEPPAWVTELLPTGQVAAPVEQPSAPAERLQSAPTAEVTATQAPDSATTPQSAPTPFVAPELAGTNPEPLAASSPEAIIVAPPFDVKTVLIEAQRPDLAETINGRMEGGRLVLEGTVASAEARDELVALLERLPAVDEVSAVNVLVRPPSSYTVQEGDTLWGISMKLYGTPDRIQAIFEANLDVLPSADALRIGMELQVPPVE